MSTLIHLLEESQNRFSQRTSLVIRQGYRTDRWSYRQLWEVSGRIAALLQQQGVHKGDRIIIWAHNSPQWVAVFFGCLRAGAIAVPLDVRSTPDFVRKVVESTRPVLVFASASTKADAQTLGLPLLALEDLPSLAAGAPASPAATLVSPFDVAEILFTSGTTGDPKGVVLTHGNIYTNVQAATQVVPVKPGYRLLSLLPLSHMLEQTVGLLSPLSGGAAVYYPGGRQPNVIFRAFKEYRITSLVLVPQALQLFLNAIHNKAQEQGKEQLFKKLLALAGRLPVPARRLLFRSVHRQLGGRLRFVMSGGAYLDPALASQWEALGVRVLQGYGATETSPIVSCNSFAQSRLDSLGKPVPGVQVKVAQDGEILVKGPNVTSGYWQNPAATDAAFTDGWYKTGDLGQLDKAGFLYFRGRKKDLIVLPSGMNVYPEDVEAQLRRHPDVTDATVVGLPQTGQDVQVHAALLLKDRDASVETIIATVNTALADHQRVQGFTLWPDDDFPRTHTLKVKKHEVIQRLLQLQTGQTPPSPPQPKGTEVSPLLRLAAQVARKPAASLSPSARLGPDAGLDSLGRVELLAAVESEMGVYLDEAQVSGETTLGELEVLAQQAAAAQQQAAPYAVWPLHPLVRALRIAAQTFLSNTLLRCFAPAKVEGREHLAGLHGPVLFAANHQSHADTPVILAALPATRRRRTAVAAAADHWFDQGNPAGTAAAFLLNAFPFSRTDSIRPSLEHCARLLDKDWSVLIYPEGTRSPDGRMGPFKSGTGLMAMDLGVPVVPVHVKGTNSVLPKDKALPRRGQVRVRFGAPLRFAPGTSYIEATQAVETAVKALAGTKLQVNEPAATT